LCIDGDRTWGRLLVVVGADTITGAVALSRANGDTASFASGGGIVGLQFVAPGADSASGTLSLANGAAFAFRARRDSTGPDAALAAHASLIPERGGVVSTDSGESYPVPGVRGELVFTRHGASLARQRIVTAPPDGGARPLMDAPAGVSDRSPSLSPDGTLLLFASTRVPGDPAAVRDTMTLWFMRANGGGWSAPTPVSWAPDDMPASPQQPVLTADGTLYFVDQRPGGLGGRDVYRARWRDGVVAEVTRVPAPISTPADEAGIHVSADGRTMIVARTRGPGHQGGDDLYVHTFVNGAWTAPVNPGLPVNTFANEYGPWLDVSGGRLWFTSDRFGSADIFSVVIVRSADGAVTHRR
jgi:hypothetical protein